jgi:threonine dehydratase
MRCSVVLDDHPGALARFIAVVAHGNGNILHIHHEQGAYDLPVHAVRVILEIETRGKDHIRSLTEALENAGYEILVM